MITVTKATLSLERRQGESSGRVEVATHTQTHPPPFLCTHIHKQNGLQAGHQ